MAKYLYRLGRWSFGNRFKVLAGWIGVLVVVGVAAAAFSGETSSKFEVPGTESQEAQELLEEKFPEASGATARVVYAAPRGETVADSENRAAIEASMRQAAGAAGVQNVVSPYEAGTISKDGAIAFGDVIYPIPADEIDDPAREQLEAIAEPAEEAGLEVEFNGGVVTTESEESSEAAGLLIGFVILAITFGSLLAAGMPLVTAILGVLIGTTAVTAMTGVIEVSETAPILATMLGLAVGIDYTLFIISRHRQNLGEGYDHREAAALAAATAGSAVVFAGATVVIALVGLTVLGIPFLTVMGLAAAATVSLAVLIAITLTPALLGFAGDRVTRVNRVLGYRREGKRKREQASLRWARFVTKRPLPVVVAGLVLLLVAAVPATGMKLGLPDDGSKSTSTTERRSYDLLTEGFGPGFNGRLTAVVDAPGLDRSSQQRVAEGLAEGLAEFPGVATVSPPFQNETGDVTVVQVTPSSGPSSEETEKLVEDLRQRADEVEADTGIEAFVTGTTAVNIDTTDRLSAALPTYVIVVVGLSLLLLTAVFRSIWVPLKATAGFLLTIGAALGIVTWIFQDGNLADLFGVAQAGPIVSFLPVLMIGILFGLAMDYEVFLVSGMRERFVRSGNAHEAVITGFGKSGRVVTAAALIMFGVFGAFVLSDDPVTKSIGVALAVGVLADAFIVRMTLVPAVMTLLGDRAWSLPKWLDRRLPNLDIEGESVTKSAAAPAGRSEAPSENGGEAGRDREPAHVGS